MKAIGFNIIPDINGFYIHIATGREYKVIGIGKMKHPEKGNWVSSVSYMPVSESDDNTYTRSLESFQVHFADAEGIIEIN